MVSQALQEEVVRSHAGRVVGEAGTPSPLADDPSHAATTEPRPGLEVAMAEPLYVVMGAAGNVGGVVANALLDAKKRVRVVGRDAAKLGEARGAGRRGAAASAEDAASLTKAFQGATAAFVMVPPSYTAPDFRAFQRKVVDATAIAIEAAKVGTSSRCRASARTCRAGTDRSRGSTTSSSG